MTKTLFLSNILLAFVWVAASGTLTQENFLFGFFIGMGILYIITIDNKRNSYFVMIPKFLGFTVYVIYQIIIANFQAARDSLYPRSRLSPAIIGFELLAETDLEITLLANFVSITPGTLVIDVSDDKKIMYIHVMHVTDKEKFILDIRENFEKRLLDIMR
jgi:multicomponent Na+:H+ antiporter subunit E